MLKVIAVAVAALVLAQAGGPPPLSSWYKMVGSPPVPKGWYDTGRWEGPPLPYKETPFTVPWPPK